MNALLALPLQNVSRQETVCTCEIHNNERLEQLDAQLPGGTPVRVLLDSLGYHVAIGDLETCPPGVSEGQARQMIQEAMRQGSQ